MSITHTYNSNILSRSMLLNISDARTLKEAKNSMGVIDKIFDLFRGGVKRQIIEKLFYAIHDNHATEQDRLNSFSALRELALSEHQNKFTIEIKQQPNSCFYYSLKIDKNEVYSREDVSQACDQQAILNAASTYQTKCLKDAFTNKCTSDILDSLTEITKVFDNEWYGSDSVRMSCLTTPDKKILFKKHEEKALDAQERNAFYEAKWHRIYTNLDLEDKKTIYSYITGEEGDRLRSVLGILQQAVADANIDEDITDDQLVSLPTKLYSTLIGIAEVIGENLGLEVPQLKEAEGITSHEHLLPDERDALPRIGLDVLLQRWAVEDLLHGKPISVVTRSGI